MELKIATPIEAAVLKRALYARLSVVTGAMSGAHHMRDPAAHRAAKMEARELTILLENTISIEARLMEKPDMSDLAILADLQRPG